MSISNSDTLTTSRLVVLVSAALPASCVNDSQVADNAEVDQAKLQHRRQIEFHQDGTVAVGTYRRGLVTVGGTVTAIRYLLGGAETAGFTLQVNKRTGASSTSLLNGGTAITINAGTVVNTVYDATLGASLTVAEDDTFEFVLAATGTTSPNGDDLVVQIDVTEDGV